MVGKKAATKAGLMAVMMAAKLVVMMVESKVDLLGK